MYVYLFKNESQNLSGLLRWDGCGVATCKLYLEREKMRDFLTMIHFRGARRSSTGSGFQPGRPTKQKETIKFETEFDFEQANEEFKGVLSNLEASGISLV